MLRVEPRRAADDDEVERTMVEKPIERVERGGAVPAGKLFGVRARRRDHGRHLHSRNFAKRARVRVADVARADEPRVNHSAPAFFSSAFMPVKLSRLDASGVPAPRQCVSSVTAWL